MSITFYGRGLIDQALGATIVIVASMVYTDFETKS